MTDWLGVAMVEDMTPDPNGSSVFGWCIENVARRTDRALAAEGRTALADR